MSPFFVHIEPHTLRHYDVRLFSFRWCNRTTLSLSPLSSFGTHFYFFAAHFLLALVQPALLPPVPPHFTRVSLVVVIVNLLPSLYSISRKMLMYFRVCRFQPSRNGRKGELSSLRRYASARWIFLFTPPK